jgi:hypothetical protein
MAQEGVRLRQRRQVIAGVQCGGKNENSRMKRSLTWVLAGVFIAIASWTPFWLWLTVTQNLHTTPVIFMYLGFAGSILGGAGTLAGLIEFVGHALPALFTKR